MYMYTYIYIYTFLFPAMTFAPFHEGLKTAIFLKQRDGPTTSWQVRVTTSNRVFKRRCRMSPIREVGSQLEKQLMSYVICNSM
jgi:hypothetical protein